MKIGELLTTTHLEAIRIGKELAKRVAAREQPIQVTSFKDFINPTKTPEQTDNNQ